MTEAPAPDDAHERLARRAAAALTQPGAYLEADGEAYRVRTGPDRRRRAGLRLDEVGFRALAVSPGLKLRPGGGWLLAAAKPSPQSPAPGRPGVIEGERLVAEADGALSPRRANLGESPLAWLARRRDPQGRPWLSPQEYAAGERLREDFHRAGLIGRLTMGWSAGPRGSGGWARGWTPLSARWPPRRGCAPPWTPRGVSSPRCLSASASMAAR